MTTKDVQLYGESQALKRMAWRVKNCVPNGRKLKDHEAMSLAQIALATGLNPFTGELWYIPGKGPMAGIKGLRRRAREQSTYSVDLRAMRNGELEDHNVKPGDVGRICELFRHDILQRAVEINKAAGEMVVPVKPILGVGIWRQRDQIASSKSSTWMANKRAEADALRQAFDLTELPYSDEINGSQLEVADIEDAAWSVSVPEDEIVRREVAINAEDGEDQKEEIKVSNDWPVRPWDAETLSLAMAKKVREYKGKSATPSEAQLDYLRSSLGKLSLSDPERHMVTLHLFDVESTGDLSAAQCSAIIDWIAAKPPDYEPSQDAKVEAQAVIRQYQLEKGQQELPV